MNLNELITTLANIATILGLPISIILIIRELKKNNESISKLADSIMQQQNIKAECIEKFQVFNSVKGEKNGK